MGKLKTGQLVSYHRRRNDFTQEEISSKTGISLERYIQIENNQVVPERDEIIQLASFFEVDVEDLSGVTTKKRESSFLAGILSYCNQYFYRGVLLPLIIILVLITTFIYQVNLNAARGDYYNDEYVKVSRFWGSKGEYIKGTYTLDRTAKEYPEMEFDLEIDFKLYLSDFSYEEGVYLDDFDYVEASINKEDFAVTVDRFIITQDFYDKNELVFYINVIIDTGERVFTESFRCSANEFIYSNKIFMKEEMSKTGRVFK